MIFIKDIFCNIKWLALLGAIRELANSMRNLSVIAIIFFTIFKIISQNNIAKLCQRQLIIMLSNKSHFFPIHCQKQILRHGKHVNIFFIVPREKFFLWKFWFLEGLLQLKRINFDKQNILMYTDARIRYKAF
jgi:hypothetical protein